MNGHKYHMCLGPFGHWEFSKDRVTRVLICVVGRQMTFGCLLTSRGATKSLTSWHFYGVLTLYFSCHLGTHTSTSMVMTFKVTFEQRGIGGFWGVKTKRRWWVKGSETFIKGESHANWGPFPLSCSRVIISLFIYFLFPLFTWFIPFFLFVVAISLFVLDWLVFSFLPCSLFLVFCSRYAPLPCFFFLHSFPLCFHPHVFLYYGGWVSC